ncbi:cation transporting ATPase [Monoraphidium neglectum]|uniref:Cation transporting ATPase n=1 Tax=Monoraphidium neglectum TaxID=145388 RepID=A0A0D2MEF9_9CHLO|nr:cation transporting ATPase [Monoraphidium neglectum]KIY93550.1 cation transporting ATPase [Monoraphidium neglectum]|eukprot:XP_013892570.1 cation transporting ATPase [Monoraphidium neglectum]
MFYWGERDGLDLGMRRAEAFSVLVGSQVAYFVNCRFLKASTLHPRVLHGNRIAYASIFSTLALVVFLVYTPGVNAFFHQAPMNGIQWARTICCIAAVYLIVEAEKAAVDPIVMPVLRPAMSWMEARVPSWLSFDWSPERARRAAAALCAAPKVKTGPLHRRSAVRRVARGGSFLAAGPGGAPAPAPRGGAVGEEAA